MKNTALDKLIRFLRTKEVVRKIKKDSVVCDLGCDEGHFLIGISKNIKRGYGIDRRASIREFRNIEFIRGDLEKNLPEIKADYVTLLAVLEHLNQPKKVIQGAHSLLREGGELILTTPSTISKPVLEALAFFRIIDENEIKDHKHYFSIGELNKLLEDCGFKKIKTKRFEFGFNLIASGTK